MRSQAVPANPAAGDVTPAVLAIGRPDFPRILIDTLRRQAGVGHCMVFALTRTGAARCLLDAGNIPIGGDLGAAYAGQFHESDPNRDALFEGEESAPIVLPSFAPRMYGARYRKIFFNDSGIVDKCATAIWVDDTCFYVNFYRIASQGRFSAAQLARLETISPAIGASVARHFQHGTTATPDQALATLFATCAPLASLTPREREVCRRILLGFSSEAISQGLGISLHSTLTYRKRAYERLGISSQNELFSIVLSLLAGPHGLN
ncbi:MULTISPECIES: LuxR C-terminal-related transcriptional regulator [unclassified Bradyrhizobium]|uniref:helix-turn-helix transcriptional regulator n=1 Tax=unclassified Bradyrhizobium TaxID=2631580 RepID=UPI0024787DF6|nr:MULTISPECIES: LuxR C-terminal-related transcriptional regulator [unclassified Bradyrhizobium]WGR70628.1 LuxR C-terminal-related transcriptional regulator [Bradyrhizobium sp. ISRA426]WGR75466.1 LuxR C-terminal-related transcriptional regulator [Bradyrhizobium sp. ISRA430]WGR85869.1 LuxR C-terminal-related transcriptional regulator [Bradyrhizobium sp. ISRA432]